MTRKDRSTLTIYIDGAKPIEINGRARIRALVFVQNGRYLLTGGDEAMIRQWRISDGLEVGEGMKTGSIVTALALSGDGERIVSSGERVANVWNMRSRQIILTVSEHSDWVDTVHVSPDSTKFATGSNDKRAYIWDISTGERLIGPLEHEGRVGAVKFSPDGDSIATGTAGGMLRIYDTHNGELLRTIPVSVASYPSLIAWSSAQSIFALVSHNILMHIDLKTGQTSSSWTIPGDPVNHFGPIALGSIASSSNGKFIVSFVGCYISLWDTSTSARISSDIRHPANVCSIALSLDSNYLAVSDTNSKITIRNLKDIISSYYLLGERDVQQPQNRSEEDLRPQIDALSGKLRALELRVGAFLSSPVYVQLNVKSDELSGTTTQPSDFLVAQPEAAPRCISDGTYRIKSNIDNLYLTCLQDRVGTVVVRKLEKSNVSQRVCHHFL